MTTATAHCLCGDVTVQASLPSKWVAHCHCSLCRRAHGAAFVTWAGIPEAQFRLTAGEQAMRWYRSTPEAERGFCMRCGTIMACSRCGSRLFFRAERWPGELHIALAHFITPVDRAPQLHASWQDHVAWADVDPNDGLPRSTPESDALG